MKILFAILLFVSSSFAKSWIYSNDDMYYQSEVDVITRSYKHKKGKDVIIGVWVKGYFTQENTYMYFNCKDETHGFYDFMLDPIDPDSKTYTLMEHICNSFRK